VEQRNTTYEYQPTRTVPVTHPAYERAGAASVVLGPNAAEWREGAATVLRQVRAHDEIVLSGSGARTFTQAWATSPHPPATIISAPTRYNATAFTPSAQTQHIWLLTMPRGTRDPAGIDHDWLYHHGPQVAPVRAYGALRVYEFGYEWTRR
jgi:hypothetical protein